jgi:amidase
MRRRHPRRRKFTRSWPRLHKVTLNRNWGYTAYRLGLFSLTPESIEGLYPNRYKEGVAIPGRTNVVPWDIDIKRPIVRLREPVSGATRPEFPAKPINLDYNEIGESTLVMLPVYHPGALLFVGDGHALQGDGEPTGTGIETSLDLEFTVDVRKKAALTGPRAETSEHIISIGSQPEFASWAAAHLLIGYQARYDVITVAGSMALKIPKKHLPQPNRWTGDGRAQGERHGKHLLYGC